MAAAKATSNSKPKTSTRKTTAKVVDQTAPVDKTTAQAVQEVASKTVTTTTPQEPVVTPAPNVPEATQAPTTDTQSVTATPVTTSETPARTNQQVRPNPQPVRRAMTNQRRPWRNNMPKPVPVNRGNGHAGFGGVVDGRMIPDAGMPTEVLTGVLDMKSDGNGVLREKYSSGDRDAYISGSQIRRFYLRPGDVVTGPARAPKDNEQFWGLLKVEKINGHDPNVMAARAKFNNLTPVYPDEKIVLETAPEILTTRIIDLVAPVGHGQRGLIVSPPKAGKTTVLKDVSTGIAKNYPDIHLMAVLIGERPEEVTDIRRHIEHITDGRGEVAASNFDEQAQEQVRISELALEKAKRLVETGRHVVILLDSITRLARAYNLAMPTSGRTLSGGFDPAALYPPKKFFGAARNFEEFDTPDGKKRASLTILGTALIDTGSRMDDLIYEEFKGTGNMELHLDRQLAERRIYPAIDVMRSGTRREDLLFDSVEYQSVIMLRRMLDMLDNKERTSVMVDRMKHTKSNKEFLATLKDG